MTDEQIIDLMTARNEQALTEVETKYSRLCESITRRIGRVCQRYSDGTMECDSAQQAEEPGSLCG